MRFIKYLFLFFLYFSLGAAGSIPVSAQETSTLIAETLNAYEDTAEEEEDLSDLFPKRVYEYQVKNTPLQEAIDVLMRKSGLRITVDSKIKTNVTLFLSNIAAMDILRILVDSYDLAYKEEDGMIRIMMLADFEEQFGYSFGEKVKTKMIPLLHADNEDIIDVLQQMRSTNGKVIFNEDTSTFILIDAPDKLENMISYIKKVDVPIDTKTYSLKHIKTSQIVDRVKSILTINVGKLESTEDQITVTDTLLKISEVEKLINEYDQAEKRIKLKTKIIQIVLNDEHVQGVDWEAIVSSYKRTSFLGMKNAIEGKNRLISWGTVSDEDYNVLLDALDTVGDISEIEEKEFESLKNRKHKLRVKPLEVISLVPEEKAYVDRNNLKEDITFFVTPKGYKDDNIEVFIQPEVFSLDEESITMSVEDGATIVIGGLFKEVTVETERRIPLLSDIPLIRKVPFHEIPILGFAFRNSKRRERLTEIIVFLSVETIIVEN